MPIEIRNARMFDTETNEFFGPQCNSDRQALELFYHIQRTVGKDPRDVSPETRLMAFSELRDGLAAQVPTHESIACQCGSGEVAAYKIYHGSRCVTKCALCLADRPKYLT